MPCPHRSPPCRTCPVSSSSRAIPRSISWVAVAVFAIYFTLPWIALSALPVERRDGEWVTELGLPPPEGFQNDPILGLVENLGLHGVVLDIAEYYVGILAATILFIATNAGVIVWAKKYSISSTSCVAAPTRSPERRRVRYAGASASSF